MSQENEKKRKEIDLGREFDLKIKNTALKEYIKQIAETIEQRNFDELNGADKESLIQYRKALEEAKNERQRILDKMNKNKDADYFNSGNEKINFDDISAQIKALEDFLTQVYEYESNSGLIIHENKEKEGANRAVVDIDVEVLPPVDAPKKEEKSKPKKRKEIKSFDDIEIDVENENEPLSYYDNTILDIIKNVDGAANFFLNNHIQLINGLLNEVKKKDLTEATDFVSNHKNNINNLMVKIRSTGVEKGGEILGKLESDIKKLEKALTEKEVKPEDSGYLPIEIFKELDLEKIAALSTNPDLSDRIQDAVNTYNDHVKRKSSKEEIETAIENIELLKREFREYRRKMKEEAKNKEKEGKKKDNKKAKKKDSTAEPAPSNEPEEAKTEEAKVEDVETEEILPEEESVLVSELKEGRDYSHIVSDRNFDSWLKTISSRIKKEGVDLSSEVKDIEDWYAEYKTYLEYKQKLQIIQESAQREASDPIKTKAIEKKLEDLLFLLHKKDGVAARLIDELLEAYNSSEKNKLKTEKLKKDKELKESLKASRVNMHGRTRALASGEVKKILESEEGYIKKSINDLLNSLENLKLNYEFYNSGTVNETDAGNIAELFQKYKATKQEDGSVAKVGFLKKFISKITSGMQSIKSEEINMFEVIIRGVRKLNLVPLKTDNTDKAREKNNNLSDLIDFAHGDFDLMSNYLTNKDSRAEMASALTPAKKKLLNMFVELFESFVDQKYKTKEASQEAEELLNSGHEDYVEPSKSTTELMFEDDAEKTMFEKKAKYDIYIDIMVKIGKEIDSMPKVKNKSKKNELVSKYNEVVRVLNEIGLEDDDKLKLQTLTLKINELILLNINTTSFEELSSSFTTYKEIISSPEILNDEKIKYIKDLLKTLTEYRKKTDNTVMQNIQLDAIIKEYKEILKSLI